MKNKTHRLVLALVTMTLGLTLTACGNAQPDKTTELTSSAKKIESHNSALKDQLSTQQSKLASESSRLTKTTSSATTSSAKSTTESKPETKKTANSEDLAELNYSGNQSVTINHNNPDFSKADLSTTKGAWGKYSDLDSHNRATDANALLNKSLMPTAKREPLTWNPTGWHNKKSGHGWLYNRSHLIGYQLSGENNNPKNLITGTRSLNAPEMLAHEMDIAAYLKSSKQHYVRYEVKPIYRGNELLARGVQMRAQSVGDNQVRFNVFIFNVEPGFKLNYNDGTSQKQAQ